LIETFALGKSFGAKNAVCDLTLRVEPGEVMAFLGPNGSGKTTTIRLLMGLLKPSAGSASILGRDCHAEMVSLKRDVGYLPEEPFLYPYLSGLELLEFVAGLHGLDRREARRRAGAAAERFGLGNDAAGFTVTYSQGMRKRLALAAALIHDPRVLILDEPTNGLDPRGAREMRDLMVGLAAEGRTIFLSTHMLDAAERVCNRVAIIRAGALQALGTPAELRARYAAAPDASLEDLFLKVTE
jgi:ABC-2 type transport system ATP-binding protein